MNRIRSMKKYPIQKAEEYLHKAKDILENTPLEDDEHYADAKSIKKAGQIAWKGCVVALDYVLYQERRDCDKYVSEYDKAMYKEWISGVDNNNVSIFESAYNLLNFTMACDGEKDIAICDRAMSYGKKLFDWCRSRQVFIEQQEAEERRRNEEEWRMQKMNKKQWYKVVVRQKKELEDLVISKSGISRKEIAKGAYDDFVRANLDLVTPEERKRFDHLVF